jgi:hypothetical protein
MMGDGKCGCSYNDDMTLVDVDFDELRKEIAELREIIEQEKKHQQSIKSELHDMGMRISIIQQQLRK